MAFWHKRRAANGWSRYPILIEWHTALSDKATGLSLDDIYGDDEDAKEEFIELTKAVAEAGLKIALNDYPRDHDRAAFCMMAGHTFAALTHEHQLKAWKYHNKLVRDGVGTEGLDLYAGFQAAFLHALYAKSVGRIAIAPHDLFPSLDETMSWFTRLGTPAQAAEQIRKIKALCKRLGIPDDAL